MPDALLIVIAVTLLYGLAIMLICVVGAKKSDRIYRMLFINVSVLYFLCLLIASFFPTGMSSKENHFTPLYFLIRSVKEHSAAGAGQWLCHMGLNLMMYLPLGVIVSVMSKLNAGRPLLTTLVSAVLIALAIELMQIFLPRAAETDDLIFEIAGALIGGLLVRRAENTEAFKKFMTSLLP